ncbi:MAG: Rne/Rng family ribonuclease, partial [Bacteroidota bacterium]
MKKEIIINASKDRSRIAIVEDGELVELYVENPDNVRTIGNIYLGGVQKVMPAIRAAFVNVGQKQDAFLHFSDLTDNAAQLIAMAGEDVPGLETPVLSHAPKKRVADDDSEPDVEDTLEIASGNEDEEAKPSRTRSRSRRRSRGRGRGRGRGRSSGGSGKREEEEEQEESKRPLPSVIDLTSPPRRAKPKPTPKPEPEDKPAPQAEPEAPSDEPTAATETDTEEEKPRSRRRSRSTPSNDAEPTAEETSASSTDDSKADAPDDASDAAPEPDAKPRRPRKPRRSNTIDLTSSSRTSNADALQADTPTDRADDSDRAGDSDAGDAEADDTAGAKRRTRRGRRGRGRRRSSGEETTEPDASSTDASDEDHDKDTSSSPQSRSSRQPRSDDASSDSNTSSSRSRRGRGRQANEAPSDSSDEKESNRSRRGRRSRGDRPEEPKADAKGKASDDRASSNRDAASSQRRSDQKESSQKDSGRSNSGRGRSGRGPNGRGSSNGRGGSQNGSNATVPSAESLLKRGTRVICKITKEPISTKGPRVSTDISLAGRFLVLVPAADYIAVSKKIESAKERRRLRTLASSLKPDGFGVIVRTVASGRDAKSLDTDLRLLLEKWRKIEKKLAGRPEPPVLLYEDVNMVSSIIRDLFSEDYDRIVVDDPKVHRNVQAYVKAVAPQMLDKVELHRKNQPVFRSHGIERQVEEAFSKRVNMKGGGYLYIETTEAMHVVDVNSGRAGRGKSQKENLIAVNVEAAKEIAKQLRLRDLGGIIVVDFIDLRYDRDRKKVTDALKEAFKKDRAVTKLLPMSDFGLVQITRQRLRPSITTQTDEDADGADAARAAGAAEIRQPERSYTPEPTAEPLAERTAINPAMATPEALSQSIRKWLDHYRKTVDDRYKARPIVVRIHPLLGAYLRRGFPTPLTRWKLTLRGISFRVEDDASVDPLAFDVRDVKSGRSLLKKYS